VQGKAQASAISRVLVMPNDLSGVNDGFKYMMDGKTCASSLFLAAAAF
jgi:hypothetical protein